LAAAEVIGRARLSDSQLQTLLQTARHDALVSPAVLLPALRRSVRPETSSLVFNYLEDALRRGWRPAPSQLDEVVPFSSQRDLPNSNRLRMLLQHQVDQQAAGMDNFSPLLEGGNSERGKAVFFDKKFACAGCHRIGSEGGSVGPDLTKIGVVRSARELLESIVMPSASLAQGYDSYIITTADGHSITGVISERTPEVVVLREPSGAPRRIPMDDIEAVDRLTTSIMPEGLPSAMTPEEFRNLLAFLQSLR
jgi:putative heme-binding domain-containing protein